MAKVWVGVESPCNECGGIPTITVYSEKPEPVQWQTQAWCTRRILIEAEVDGSPVEGEEH